MRLGRLRVFALRGFGEASLDCGAGLTVLRGDNASGKTTMLEAAYLLARGESFRARRHEECIQQQAEAAAVDGLVQAHPTQDWQAWQVRVQRSGVTVQCDHETRSRRAQAQAMPVLLVDRQQHRLLDEGPVYRRKFVDLGLFYVEPSFLSVWRLYERALQQRNAALRTKQALTAVSAWNAQLAEYGERLHLLRSQHVQDLARRCGEELCHFLPGVVLQWEFRAGFDTQQPLAEQLAAHWQRDLQLGYTHTGPHRCELRLKMAEGDARSVASRGQQKMLMLAMTLAQASAIQHSLGAPPLILLDDLEAELAPAWQRRVLDRLLRYAGQCLVTTLQWPTELANHVARESTTLGRPLSVFHVEPGRLSPQPND